MTPERLARVEELFHAARALGATERSAYLDTVCSGDSDLRREVESLLSAGEGEALGTAGALAAARPSSPGGQSGRTLGPYRLGDLLGSGGMGEVYRARDTRLGRDVAIKVLPADRMADEDRRRRFVQEARAASALNHPNIVTIYEIESAEGMDFIVMECIVGQTLDKLIGRGMRLAEALKIAIPIADALARAHAAGIVHRDLKPSNVMVTPEGVVKVLDFGLAKLITPADPRDAEQTRTQETPSEFNRPATIAGTPGYMSPEQAMGGPVDARSDVFAFGAVLYEMVTGRRAFARRTSGEVIAAAIREDPKPPSEHVPSLPKQLDKLILRCLMKEPDRRSQHMSDVRVELLEIKSDLGLRPVAEAAAGSRRWWLTTGAVAVALAGVLLWRPRASAPTSPLTRFSVPLPFGVELPPRGGLAISPDGQAVVFAGYAEGTARLYFRRLDEWETRAIPGTDGAHNPFYSPDGEWIAFATEDNRIKKVSVRGGAAQVICQTCPCLGGTWSGDDQIIFSNTYNAGLWRVPAAGGAVEQLPGPAVGQSRDLWPEMLPDGKTVLVTVWQEGKAHIAARSLRTGEQRTLVDPGGRPRYSATGHLLFNADGRLHAVRFDPTAVATRGPAAPVLDAISSDPYADEYAISQTGTLFYATLSPSPDRLVWRDRHGATIPLQTDRGTYFDPVLSPDEERIALTVQEGFARNIWIHGVRRKELSRLTFSGDDVFSLWSPDGTRVVFTSSREGPYNIFVTAADASGAPQRLTNSKYPQRATSWSPDGTVLLYHEIGPATGRDIWLVSPNGDRTARPFIRTPFNEMEGVFSPDGRWVAFMSDESGRWEVYVAAYPGPGAKKLVSIQGGWSPTWNANGREIFYQTGVGIFFAPISAGPPFTVGEPKLLFERRSDVPLNRGKNFSVSRDGQRFLMVEKGAPTELNVVVNWFDELKRRVPPTR